MFDTEPDRLEEEAGALIVNEVRVRVFEALDAESVTMTVQSA